MTKQEAINEAERIGGTYEYRQTNGDGWQWVVIPPSGEPQETATSSATRPASKKKGRR